MSSNRNDTVNLSNYEEWFVLYMDNELHADEKAAVEAFLLLHPHLQEELDLLLGTKLPADDVAFVGKQSLMAESMKLNAVDESLLLYLDNELPTAERKAVEKKLATDKGFKLQHAILQQTKLDASEVVPYPDKKELYRHTQRVISFPTWMRVAVAVVLIIFAAFFFVTNKGANTATPAHDLTRTDVPAENQNSLPKKGLVAPSVNNTPVLQQQSTASLKADKPGKTMNIEKPKTDAALQQKQPLQQQEVAAMQQAEKAHQPKIEFVQMDVKKLTEQPTIAINISTANPGVTLVRVDSLKQLETPDVAAVTDGGLNYKKGSARGLLRKVSRFIGRRTGIGTVSSGNETLVGMVALKLN